MKYEAKRWMKPRAWWQEHKSRGPWFKVVLNLLWYPSGWGLMRRLSQFRVGDEVWGLREQGGSKVVLPGGKSGGAALPGAACLHLEQIGGTAAPWWPVQAPAFSIPREFGLERSREGQQREVGLIPVPTPSCLHILSCSSGAGQAVTGRRWPWTRASSNTPPSARRAG